MCHRFIDGKSLRVSHWHALVRRAFRAIRAQPYQRETLLFHVDTCNVVAKHGIDAGHALASKSTTFVSGSAQRPTKRPIALKHCGIQAICYNMMFAIVLNDKQAHARIATRKSRRRQTAATSQMCCGARACNKATCTYAYFIAIMFISSSSHRQVSKLTCRSVQHSLSSKSVRIWYRMSE
jgi:hypothetical protein